MNFPKDLKYTKEHEWVRMEGNVATVGITQFAQGELGDIVFVEVETEGEDIKQDEIFGSIEAVKTVSDLFMPLSGKVTEFNSKVEEKPELINNDPYGEGWIIKIDISDMEELGSLMDAVSYQEVVA